MGFQGRGNMHGVGRIERERVGDRHDRHHLASFDDLAAGDNGAGTVFPSFLGSPPMLPAG